MVPKLSLLQLTSLKEDPLLSKEYVFYLLGEQSHQYRHHEILDIVSLLENAGLQGLGIEGYLYGYSIPELNKEFDLLKIGEEVVVNIELKTQQKPSEVIKKQLKQNYHYLRMLHKRIYCFTYVSETKTLYQLEDGNLAEGSFNKLRKIVSSFHSIDIDLDTCFSPSEVFVSPLNQPMRFLSNDYLLTDHQENIKKELLGFLKKSHYVALTGGASTGKTMLLYDLAKQLSYENHVYLYRQGNAEEGELILENALPNFRIIHELDALADEGYLFLDEANLVEISQIEGFLAKTKKSLLRVLCCFDVEEGRKEVNDILLNVCEGSIAKLTSKIRANKKMASFISCLQNLYQYQGQRFDYVRLCYVGSCLEEQSILHQLEEEGYQYADVFELDRASKQRSVNEYVMVMMDDRFYYEGDILRQISVDGDELCYIKNLCRSIAQARKGVAIIIKGKALLSKLLFLFQH